MCVLKAMTSFYSQVLAGVTAVHRGVCLEGPRWEVEAILLLIQGVSPVESIAHRHLGPCSVFASELGNSLSKRVTE